MLSTLVGVVLCVSHGYSNKFAVAKGRDRNKSNRVKKRSGCLAAFSLQIVLPWSHCNEGTFLQPGL